MTSVISLQRGANTTLRGERGAVARIQVALSGQSRGGDLEIDVSGFLLTAHGAQATLQPEVEIRPADPDKPCLGIALTQRRDLLGAGLIAQQFPRDQHDQRLFKMGITSFDADRTVRCSGNRRDLNRLELLTLRVKPQDQIVERATGQDVREVHARGIERGFRAAQAYG